MTETKVTNYQLSKRLNELNFDSQTHCGWWHLCEDGSIHWYSNKNNFLLLTNGKEKLKVIKAVKAYDCSDLIAAYKNIVWTEGIQGAFDIFVELLLCDDPQNALASAIIKILEEGKC